VGFSGGLYMFCFSVYYFIKYTDFKDNILSNDSFFAIQMVFISFSFAAMCGAVSLLASYLFVEKIYLASKNGDFVRF
jgi:hypothetical protein